MTDLLERINSAVWGAPTLLLLFFTGVILSVRTRFFQLRHIKSVFSALFAKDEARGGITPRQSAMAALSGTLGTGNIVGVAGAISLGGPGAVFWMWVSALFSMILKFAEIVLAVRYREQLRDGTLVGGAMYYIKNALPRALHFLGVLFAVCGTAAAFGIGNLTQINTLTGGVVSLAREAFTLSAQGTFYIKLGVGVVCACLLAAVFKSEGRIGAFCERLIPLATLLYFLITAGAIAVNYRRLPQVFADIFTAAFSPAAVTGGAVGSAFIGLRFGMSRGVFSNEAGMGTAPIAYACCDGDEVQLGFLGIFEVFVDTVVVCTLTALTVLCVGDITYGTDLGATLTLSSLTAVYGRNVVFVFCPALCLFAFSSVVGWGLYGTRFVTFLFGPRAKGIFLCCFCASAVAGAIFRADAVWLLAEILNGVMAIPNTTALLMLSSKVAEIVREYEDTMCAAMPHAI